MTKNYSYKEYLLRAIWWIISPLFRYSPRHFYGWRVFLLRIMGARIKSRVKIYPSCRITFPWNLLIGNNVTIGWDVRIYNLGNVVIDDNVVISQNSHLCAGTHNYKSHNFDLLKSTIRVKNNVWIAADAFIGPNVIVEEYCIIGARTVLMKNTEINSIYVGNPAVKVINNASN